MTITYKELLGSLLRLDDEQLNCDVTVEIQADNGNECYAIDSLSICNDTHDSLDENHPVLFLPM